MKLYAVAWGYCPDDDGELDFGVCEGVFEDEEKAKVLLLGVVGDDFNTLYNEGYEPKVNYGEDWARIETRFGHYEYKITIVNKED